MKPFFATVKFEGETAEILEQLQDAIETIGECYHKLIEMNLVITPAEDEKSLH